MSACAAADSEASNSKGKIDLIHAPDIFFMV
jgi:hypothetical protein